MRRPPVSRIGSMFGVFLLAFAAIVVRLVVLQVRDADAYQEMAEQQHVRTVPLPAMRGAILDRFGKDLALSLEARAIYADPRYVTDPHGEAEQLAPLLGLKVPFVVSRLSEDDAFAYIARQVDLPLADKVAALDLDGIGFLRESKRYYPSGEWGAPQVLGIVGVDDSPQGGLELQYDSILAGADGERTMEIDPSGRPIPHGADSETPPIPGTDIVTTIDPQLQYQAQAALQSAVKTNSAQGGTVIMMNPQSGDIYAMATYMAHPKSNSPNYRTANPAVGNVYEPGSVNKVITASAVIEEEKVDLTDVFEVPDQITFYDATIHDAEPHPVENMMLGDIITHSSNVGTIKVAGKLGPDLMATYLSKFGYGQPTGLGFPGESRGILRPEYDWSGTSMATIPIGQGVSVTPLQMLDVYATIANGGRWVQPRLVKGTMDEQGEFQPASAPVTRRVVSPETAAIVTGMLAQVVTSGTGTAAEIPGYWVAGKTGTSLIPKENGGYYKGKYIASFIGFLPATDPQIAIAVILDQPSTIYGGVASAPVFQQLGKEAIARLRIPTSEKPSFPPSAMGRG